MRPLCLGARPGGSGLDGGGGSQPSSGDILIGAGGGIVSVDGRRGGVSGRRSGKMDLAVASESAALTGLGFSLKRDVRAGEAVFLDVRTGSVSSRDCAPSLPCRREGREGDGVDAGGGGGGSMPFRFKPCLFEYVYMARPDSILDGVPVNNSISSDVVYCTVLYGSSFSSFREEHELRCTCCYD